jgi:hypothetical protein
VYGEASLELFALPAHIWWHLAVFIRLNKEALSRRLTSLHFDLLLPLPSTHTTYVMNHVDINNFK